MLLNSKIRDYPLGSQRWSHLKIVCPSPCAFHLTVRVSPPVCVWPSLLPYPLWGPSRSPRIQPGPSQTHSPAGTEIPAEMQSCEGMPCKALQRGPNVNVHRPCPIWSLLLQCPRPLSVPAASPAPAVTSPWNALSPSCLNAWTSFRAQFRACIPEKAALPRQGNSP